MKEFDCGNCPLSWEDRGYEGDCDCGCLVYGDLYGNKFTCRLPMFIKDRIASRKQKKIDKEMAHQYDGMVEWYEERQKKENTMRTAIKEILLTDKYSGNECFICNDDNGKLYKLDTDSILLDSVMELIDRYEELLREREE